jgi:hypothetical protein
VIEQDLFITQGSFLGVFQTHPGVAIGDKVYVLLGGNTPFFLKPLEEEKYAYRLKGTCYVHDYVDGKAISTWRKGELQLKKIHLI